MVNAKTKKTVKSSGEPPERKSSKQKLSVKRTTSKRNLQKKIQIIEFIKQKTP